MAAEAQLRSAAAAARAGGGEVGRDVSGEGATQGGAALSTTADGEEQSSVLVASLAHEANRLERRLLQMVVWAEQREEMLRDAAQGQIVTLRSQQQMLQADLSKR